MDNPDQLTNTLPSEDQDFFAFITQFFPELDQIDKPELLHPRLTPRLINAPDKKGETLLHFACMTFDNNNLPIKNFDENSQLKLTRLLLLHGANVKAKNNKQETPFEYALNNNLFRLASVLAKWGADIECVHNGLTCLHRAIYAGDLERCKFLLKIGADCTAKIPIDSPRNTPLHLIAEKKFPEEWWILFLDYGAGIRGNVPLWKELKLDWLKILDSKFVYRFSIDVQRDTRFASDKDVPSTNCCFSTEQLEKAINNGKIFNLKAFIRVAKKLAGNEKSPNPVFVKLKEEFIRLKKLQNGLLGLRVRPLSKYALKQLLLKSVVTLPPQLTAEQSEIVAKKLAKP